MKKLFLIIFVIFCAIIIYQIVLGKNGIIEHFRIQKIIVELTSLKVKLLDYKKELFLYIEELQDNEKSLESFAQNMGFFEDNEMNLLKIIIDNEDNNIDSVINIEKFILDKNVDEIINEIDANTYLDKKVKRTRHWIEILFYLFFGFFIVLIIMGKNKE